MKRIVCVILVVCLTCIGLSASAFSFGLGNYARSSILVEDEFPFEQIINPPNYRFGTDMRLQVFFAEVAMTGVFSNANAWLDGIVTIGINTPLFGFLDIGVGIGPYYGFYFDDDEILIYRHYLQPDDPEAWWYHRVDSFSDVLTDSVIGYRAHVDMRLGNLSFGISLDVPSYGYTFSSATADDIGPNFDKARIGASAMYWFL